MADLDRLMASMANLDEVSKTLEQTSKKKFEKPDADGRYWKLTRGEDGNGFAEIRFLPPAAVDENNNVGKLYVQIWDHAFHGSKGEKGPWYIEKSRTTLGHPDPVSEYNSKLWNSGLESNKEIARKQKRRLKYHCNILVVNDPANPANNGKVFLYSFGKKIFEKIQGVMKPQYADKQKINPFDFMNGANFKLRIRQGSNNFPTYEDSEFSSPTPLFGGDKTKIVEVWEAEHSLTELLEEKNFKTYDELKTQLNRVLDIADAPAQTATVSRSSQPATVHTAPLASVADRAEKAIKSTDTSMKSFEDLLNS